MPLGKRGECSVVCSIYSVTYFHGGDCFPAGRGISLLAMTFPAPVIASEAKQSSSVPAS